MPLKIRFSRAGAKKRPYYHMVVADVRAPRDGRFIEKVGAYAPLLARDDARRVVLQPERIRYWLGVGAKPTDRVLRFLDDAGIATRTPRNNPMKGKPGAKALERLAAATPSEEASSADASS